MHGASCTLQFQRLYACAFWFEASVLHIVFLLKSQRDPPVSQLDEFVPSRT
ncbi:unnamed protein product [Chondrus crispus]|uniref:Uncharacterized protein n=1 Tax=Chondrus crispus TaxID=2769 RepID=R7QDM7_CHOCR|nr:unnamed protein product [Chondrus crispus]CDF35515.1 unnamed protein product [Chondrus crispus]|eukprot:XP_005715334.1 unnamed protein product [Chondrus crispus]